jgi:phosphatidylserine synthase
MKNQSNQLFVAIIYILARLIIVILAAIQSAIDNASHTDLVVSCETFSGIPIECDGIFLKLLCIDSASNHPRCATWIVRVDRVDAISILQTMLECEYMDFDDGDDSKSCAKC